MMRSGITCASARYDDAGKQMTGQLSRAAGGRKARIENAAFGRRDGDGLIRSFVARRERIERAFHRVDRIGVGVVEDAVDAAIDLRRGAGVVDVHPVAGDRHGARDAGQVVVKSIGFQLRPIDAVGHRDNGAAHGGIGARVQHAAQLLQVDQPDVIEKFHDPPDADFICDHLRLEVAENLARDPDIGEQELRQLIFDRAIKHVALTLALRFKINGHLRVFQTQDEHVTLLPKFKLARGIKHRIDWI
jgi:hypothetical protein